jgi:hypothetical protein
MISLLLRGMLYRREQGRVEQRRAEMGKKDLSERGVKKAMKLFDRRAD